MNQSLHVLLEDIRSIYNVGSAFRTSDAAGVNSLILTGLTAHPPHPKLAKTALGATNTVSWEYHEESLVVCNRVKSQDISIVSIEISDTSTSLFDFTFPKHSCLVFGNEVNGVSPQLIANSDHVVHIPMYGKKQSLNVASAFAIALYEYRRQHQF